MMSASALAFAQPGQSYPPRRGPVVVNRPAASRGNMYTFTARQRDRAMAKIHRNYDKKIRQVNKRIFMNRYRKADKIRQLERQRNVEIGRINARYFSVRNRANPRVNPRIDHHRRRY